MRLILTFVYFKVNLYKNLTVGNNSNFFFLEIKFTSQKNPEAMVAKSADYFGKRISKYLLSIRIIPSMVIYLLQRFQNNTLNTK